MKTCPSRHDIKYSKLYLPYNIMHKESWVFRSRVQSLADVNLVFIKHVANEEIDLVHK